MVADWLVWENGGTKAVRLASGKLACINPVSFKTRRAGQKRYVHLPEGFRKGLEAMPHCAPEPLADF